MPKTVTITYFDLEEFTLSFCWYVERRLTTVSKRKPKIILTSYGEEWDLAKHTQGTEVKSITYSAMKITHPSDTNGITNIWVIVDI